MLDDVRADRVTVWCWESLARSRSMRKFFFESVRLYSIFPHLTTSREIDSSAVVCGPVRVTHLTESEWAGNLKILVKIWRELRVLLPGSDGLIADAELPC